MTSSWLRRVTVAATAVGAVAMAGCGSVSSSGSAGAASAAGQRVTIEGNNSLQFTPMTVHVHAGTVRIALKDMGAYPHNLVIPSLHATSPTVTGDPGGATARFTVNFPHAGRYPFHCQYHQSAGMTGVFVVS
jgi:plastocyanin